MLLSQLFEQLAFGEFRKFGIGNDDQGGILPADYRRIIPFVNLALTELHKRFLLISKTVIVQQYGHISRYRLLNQYRQSDTASTEKYKYICDTAFEPFDENGFLHTESICAEDGSNYPLNDNKKPYSLFTPEYNIIEVPYPLNENAMVITYRADHPALEHEGMNVLSQRINLPNTFTEALLMYAAGRYLMTSGSQEKEMLGTALMQKFEISVNNVKSNGLDPREEWTNTKLEMRGWR